MRETRCSSLRSLVAVIALFGLLVASCGSGDDGVTTESTTTSQAPTTPVPDQEVVRVYWLRDTGIAVGGREVNKASLPDSALDALITGPNTLEIELGMSSAIPAGSEVLGLTIDGEVRDAILSHGLEATGLTREGLYDAVGPAIVVESPYPGQPVTSPLIVTGFSRTFESNVIYDIVIPTSGEIVANGFTTAAHPDVNLFGPFEFSVEFATDIAGFGAVIVYEASAKDGSPINTYEVPVMMEPAAG